jgi:hypothetical protein
MFNRAKGAATLPVAARQIGRSKPHSRSRTRLLGALAAALAGLMLLPGSALAFNFFHFSFIGPLNTVTEVGSTVPGNGDVNPYGIVTVPNNVGTLVRGDLLISNFNNSKNEQGTGTTIVQVSPDGAQSLFAQINPATLPLIGPCPGGVGLTTALDVLPDGYVVVGSLPSANGEAATAQPGCLIVLDPWGHVVKTIAGGAINGPWDMTAVSGFGTTALFVTNVFGAVAGGETTTYGGTVSRIILNSGFGHPPVVTSEKVIATGFSEATNEAAFVLAPTGVALSAYDTLYVADTLSDRIAAVPDALFRQSPIGGGGITVTKGGGLNFPLGLTLAPNGDILTANGGDGNIVETTPFGFQFPPKNTGAEGGGLFGLTVAADGHGIYFVNDTENTLDLLH